MTPVMGQQLPELSIEATPTSYTWHFGDDGDLTTSDAGAPYPDLRITNRYSRVGDLRQARGNGSVTRKIAQACRARSFMPMKQP